MKLSIEKENEIFCMSPVKHKKTNAEYKRDQRERDKIAGKKRIEFLIDPINELRIRAYVHQLESEVNLK